jgi:hypothetical protein
MLLLDSEASASGSRSARLTERTAHVTTGFFSPPPPPPMR